jgi:hypothetical protein
MTIRAAPLRGGAVGSRAKRSIQANAVAERLCEIARSRSFNGRLTQQ